MIGQRKSMISSKHNRWNPGKIGLALGGGSARGWSHIGVIRALTAFWGGPEVACCLKTNRDQGVLR